METGEGNSAGEEEEEDDEKEGWEKKKEYKEREIDLKPYREPQ